MRSLSVISLVIQATCTVFFFHSRRKNKKQTSQKTHKPQIVTIAGSFLEDPNCTVEALVLFCFSFGELLAVETFKLFLGLNCCVGINLIAFELQRRGLVG